MLKPDNLAFVFVTLAFLNTNSMLVSNASKPQPKISQSQNLPPSAAYLNSVKQRLEHFWTPARAQKIHATVAFRIVKDGRIGWVELTDAASDTAANFSALDAVSFSTPFQSPASQNFVDVEADFDSDFFPQYRLWLFTSEIIYSNKKKGEVAQPLLSLTSLEHIQEKLLACSNFLLSFAFGFNFIIDFK